MEIHNEIHFNVSRNFWFHYCRVNENWKLRDEVKVKQFNCKVSFSTFVNEKSSMKVHQTQVDEEVFLWLRVLWTEIITSSIQVKQLEFKLIMEISLID